MYKSLLCTRCRLGVITPPGHYPICPELPMVADLDCRKADLADGTAVVEAKDSFDLIIDGAVNRK